MSKAAFRCWRRTNEVAWNMISSNYSHSVPSNEVQAKSKRACESEREVGREWVVQSIIIFHLDAIASLSFQDMNELTAVHRAYAWFSETIACCLISLNCPSVFLFDMHRTPWSFTCYKAKKCHGNEKLFYKITYSHTASRMTVDVPWKLSVYPLQLTECNGRLWHALCACSDEEEPNLFMWKLRSLSSAKLMDGYMSCNWRNPHQYIHVQYECCCSSSDDEYRRIIGFYV